MQNVQWDVSMFPMWNFWNGSITWLLNFGAPGYGQSENMYAKPGLHGIFLHRLSEK